MEIVSSPQETSILLHISSSKISFLLKISYNESWQDFQHDDLFWQNPFLFHTPQKYHYTSSHDSNRLCNLYFLLVIVTWSKRNILCVQHMFHMKSFHYQRQTFDTLQNNERKSIHKYFSAFLISKKVPTFLKGSTTYVHHTSDSFQWSNPLTTILMNLNFDEMNLALDPSDQSWFSKLHRHIHPK